jgi:hypothetical protein
VERATEERFAALVSMGLTAARSLERALFSLDPEHQRAAKELATFLLGIVRTLEVLEPGVLEVWRARVSAALGRDVLELCRRTGEPAFMEPDFLAFLTASEEPHPPPG